ncbi:Rrf2 family transcriptional regulator [Candidatus Enterococcus courvalinii]|uniref:Rrf2 family transcriptional regulator n=1 Tax=Candidatus Enterococcus courvalinii TaxID=2815329 RepID=UPI001F5DD157|nr:Rrf2 family transcriptional regulator [Enterococcus sp. MSG2901]
MRPEEISLTSIYKAVEKASAIFHSDKNTAPNCLIGGNIQKVLDQTYIYLQQSVENEMKTFLSDIIAGILQESANG